MIYDKLENLHLYRGLYENLDKAIDYLETHDLSVLENGKNIVDGDYIFINVVNGKLIPETEGIFELHHNYLDIHIEIEGAEKVLYTDYISEKVEKAYDEEGDYELLKGIKTSECMIDKDHFTICMTGEPHMPCVQMNDKQTNRKVIVKIRVN